MALDIKIHPGDLVSAQKHQLRQLTQHNVLGRLWEHDHTLWDPEPDEITNRLDWLTLHESMKPNLEELSSFARELCGQGFETAVLLGMGGSSLAPEVFSNIFGTRPGFLQIKVLDTTDSMAIRNAVDQIDLDSSVFIVATKSGGTVETLSLFKYFYNQVAALPNVDEAGKHFIAITDPGSRLEKLAEELNFRKTFLNNPNLGGRYSALSYFGLLPAALLGCDLGRLLHAAAQAARANSIETLPKQAPAAQIGALIGAGAGNGRDKLTFLSDQNLSNFSDWVEQLIAESTGKGGKGILPVVGETPPEDLDSYSRDRIFVLQNSGDSIEIDVFSKRLRELGFPVIETAIDDQYDLGGLTLTWEIAVALAGHLMDIHPFNQPDVESAKILARESVQAYRENGMLPERETTDISAEALAQFLSDLKPGAYISLQAYLTSDAEIEQTFRILQAKLRDRYHAAVTFGFGPRFLHSTGQLHKGDAGHGHFIQFVSKAKQDLDIPETAGGDGSLISFDTLKLAQAIGDGSALTGKGRHLLVFSLENDILNTLKALVNSL